MRFKSKNIAIRAGSFYVVVFHVDDAKLLEGHGRLGGGE